MDSKGLCVAMLLAAAVVSPDVSAGYIGGYSDEFPNVWLGFHNLVVSVGPAATTESYDSRSNHHGLARLGPCRFSSTQQSLFVGSGGWYGTVSQPGGRASGELDCVMSAELLVLAAYPEGPGGAAFVPGYDVGTPVRFDPALEVASYGWTIGVTLTSLDTGLSRSYGEFARSRYCGPPDGGVSTGFSCVNFYDYNFAPLFGYAPGDRVRADLIMRLHFDLRSLPVSEPPTLALLAAALFPALGMVPRRRAAAMRHRSRTDKN